MTQSMYTSIKIVFQQFNNYFAKYCYISYKVVATCCLRMYVCVYVCLYVWERSSLDK